MNVVATAQRAVAQPRSVTILGATGSVGCNTIDLIAQEPDRFVVEALTGNRNAALLAQQARQVRARLAVVADEEVYPELKAALAGTGIEAAAGRNALIEAALRPAECVMASIVGAAGLEPTLAAVQRGAIIGLANKESLVCAGELVTAEIARCNGTLIPVDSEHSAIFQVFEAENAERVERVILTASGGPFRTWEHEAIAGATVDQALNHPTWRMGAKITVDSATLANKALELIEAHFLFGLGYDALEAVVHPQSIVHAFVEFPDGSVLAQVGFPSMEVPILYALTHPTRLADSGVRRFDPVAAGPLTFEPVRRDAFRAFELGVAAGRAGGTAPAVFNAANEVAVAAFLDRRVTFGGIADVIARTLDLHQVQAASSVEVVQGADAEARRVAAEGIA